MKLIVSTATLALLISATLFVAGCGGGGGGGGATNPPPPATPPTAAKTREGTSPTTDSTVMFDVLFSANVVNVDASDFVVTTTGSATADALVVVSDAGDTNAATYVVTVTNVALAGNVELDFAPGTDIVDGVGTALDQTPTADEAYAHIDGCTPETNVPGNVGVVMNGSDIIVTPDGGDNGIVVEPDMIGDIVVRGTGGTTINGGGTQVTFAAGVPNTLPGRLTINSSSGADNITISGVLITGATKVSGCGAAVLNIVNTSIFDALTVEFLDGINQVACGTVNVSGPTSIQTGNGNDIVTLGTTSFLADLVLNTGGGNDTAQCVGVDVTQATTVDLGAGDDVLDCDNFTASSTCVCHLGADNDAVRFLNSMFTGDASLNITTGNNIVDLQGTTCNAAISVTAATGALGLRIKNNTFNGLVTATGGPGVTDVLMDNGTSSFGQVPLVTGFEDLTNTHIDTVFANLLGLLFP